MKRVYRPWGQGSFHFPRAVHECSQTGARKQCSMHENQVLSLTLAPPSFIQALVARREEKGVDLPSRILQPCKEISRKRKEGGVSPVDERCAMRAPKHVYIRVLRFGIGWVIKKVRFSKLFYPSLIFSTVNVETFFVCCRDYGSVQCNMAAISLTTAAKNDLCCRWRGETEGGTTRYQPPLYSVHATHELLS